MEDVTIIGLYWSRDEAAIQECQLKYGSYCRTIANNILSSAEDVEECINDTWLRAWNAIPPARPGRLSVFLGKITRNLAIDKYRKDNAQKHGSGQTALCLDELSECIGERSPIEDKVAFRDLLNTFLSDLSEKHQSIFLMRYWYFLSNQEIAQRHGISEGAVKMTLQRIRKKLKVFLEKEGVGI